MTERVFEACPKCGCEDVYVRFIDGDDALDRAHFIHRCDLGMRRVEHFHLGCQRCAYKWNEER